MCGINTSVESTLVFDRKGIEKFQPSFLARIFRRHAAACNEHIAKIAALPRVDKKSETFARQNMI